MSEKRKIIAIVGPTASGKTSWGVPIAKKYDGEIISADSRQIYRGLNIGTSKDLADYNGVKYHLIDIKNPGDEFTLFDWLKLAREAIEDIFSHGTTPIIIGGTGLYVQALAEGFQLESSQIVNLKSKKYSRAELEKKSLKQLQNIFRKSVVDNDVDEDNAYRLIRAIERAQSGETVAKIKPNFEVLQIAINRPREVLYQQIDQGVDEWFCEGFIEEVQDLLDEGVDAKWLEKIGLEYRILTKYLIENQSDFEEMKQEMKFAIHAYARRQLTWFRRFPEIIWCKDLACAERKIKKFLLQ
jgi:tRNA dimethylallyltransferase